MFEIRSWMHLIQHVSGRTERLRPLRLHRRSRLRRCLVEQLESRDLLAVSAIGPEVRINSVVTDSQQLPAIATDAEGDYVVTWQSNGQDGSGFGIFAQRYNSAGVAQGSEFRVNTTTANDQTNPAVTMDADGDFVITWQSDQQDGSFNGNLCTAIQCLGRNAR